MGREKRLRRERIQAGLEESFSQRRTREYREQVQREHEAFNALPPEAQARILRNRRRIDGVAEALMMIFKP